jgi:Tol biopolymer transport system component
LIQVLLRPVIVVFILAALLIAAAGLVGRLLPPGQIIPLVIYNQPVIVLVDVNRKLNAARAHYPNIIFETSLSPDQRQLAYTMSNGDRLQVYIGEVYESRTRELSSLGTGVTSAAWSPDGNQMALIATEESGNNLYLVAAPPASIQPSRLLGAGSYAMPRWSPDGRHLIFTSARVADLSDIFVLDIACGSDCDGQIYQVTSTLSIETFPVWSPDGRQIVFLSDRSGDYEIYALDSSCLEPGNVPCRQQNPRRLRLNKLIVPFFLAWSRDSRQIIFRGWDLSSNQPGLFAIDADCYRLPGRCPVTLLYDLTHLVARKWS